MKYFIIFALASAATADRLEKVYLPANAGSSSGANAGLQTPLGVPQKYSSPSGPSQNFGGASQNFGGASQNYGGASQILAAGSASNAEILKYDNEINEDGYRYAYETSDGTKAEQQGRVIPGATPEEGSLQVSGSYSYVGDDGQTYSVTYTADENGYHAEGAHLPTSPPIPEAILKSLQLTDPSSGQSQGQYGSQKSSYDADAGY